MFIVCSRTIMACFLFVLISSCASHVTNTNSTPLRQSATRQLAQIPNALQPKTEPTTHIARVKAAPAEELFVQPSLRNISSEWSIHPYELNKQATALELFIRNGRFPKNYCANGKAKNPKAKHLCDQVYEIIASYSKNKGVRRAKNKTHTRTRQARNFKISSQNLLWSQKQHYDDLMKAITPLSTSSFVKMVPALLKHQSCPRNLSAAGIRKLENLLPDNNAKLAMEQLYAHASFCLRPSDAGYYPTHFRQALLRIIWGDHSRARIAASLAPMGATGEELPRALFWAGIVQTEPTIKHRYWNQLIENHPLSFHALNAHKQMNTDPLADAAARPLVKPTRHSQVAEVDLSLRWFEALMLTNKITAASRLAFWTASNLGDDLSLGNIIYITHVKADQNKHQSSFGFVWQQIEKNPENMNEQTLKLLFPTPYWDVFKRSSGKNDPLLLLSVAKQESAFNPLAKSPANARGLLQLLPTTAYALAGKHVNLYSPETNAVLGSKFLNKMIERFDSVELALAAYNAGPMRVPTWKKRFPTKSSVLFIDLIPFKETRNYVANILRNNYWYQRLYSDAPFREISGQNKNQSTLVSSLIRSTQNNESPSSTVSMAQNEPLEPNAR